MQSYVGLTKLCQERSKYTQSRVLDVSSEGRV
jgi:hypothetical protein